MQKCAKYKAVKLNKLKIGATPQTIWSYLKAYQKLRVHRIHWNNLPGKLYHNIYIFYFDFEVFNVYQIICFRNKISEEIKAVMTMA